MSAAASFRLFHLVLSGRVQATAAPAEAGRARLPTIQARGLLLLRAAVLSLSGGRREACLDTSLAYELSGALRVPRALVRRMGRGMQWRAKQSRKAIKFLGSTISKPGGHGVVKNGTARMMSVDSTDMSRAPFMSMQE